MVTDQERKLKALGALFLLCPETPAEPAVLKLYLHVLADIGAAPVEAAIGALMREWRYRNAPQPGAIRACALGLMRTERRRRRQQEVANRRIAVERPMTREEASTLLATLEAQDPPTERIKLLGHELMMNGLARVIAVGPSREDIESGQWIRRLDKGPGASLMDVADEKRRLPDPSDP